MATVTDYGTDIACYITEDGLVDIDDSLRVVSGVDVVVFALLRRLTTRRGSLGQRHPNYGHDIRQYLRKGMTPADIKQAQRDISLECVKDKRVGKTICTLVMDAVNKTMKMTLNVLLRSGETFERVFVITPDKISLVTSNNN